LMLAMGNSSIQFVSDASLPSVLPTSSVPEFSWLMILPLFLSLLSIVFLFRKRKFGDGYD
jgi:hypothetical protein